VVIVTELFFTTISKVYYLSSYLVNYNYAWWQADYPYTLDRLNEVRASYPDLPVYFTRGLGRPSTAYFWYNKIDPVFVQEQKDNITFDQAEITSFPPDNIYFSDTVATSTALIVEFDQFNNWLDIYSLGV
jgi:hypothetical protein